MKKVITTLLLVGVFASSKAQTTIPLKKIMGDTIPVIITYSDTSCHYDKGSVQSIYNSRCMKQDSGFAVYTMYTTEFLDKKKKPIGKNIDIWFYKLRQ